MAAVVAAGSLRKEISPSEGTFSPVRSGEGEISFRSSRLVQAAGDRIEDQALDRVPIVHQLPVRDSDDVITRELEPSVVLVVARALTVDVMTAVDLDDESLADQQVYAVAEDRRLPPHRQPQPLQPGEDDRFRTGVGERARVVEQASASARPRQALDPQISSGDPRLWTR